ncbi:MAG: hypothetical protein ABSB84_07980 [Verrucomicrobiota bacterium]|jgi:hypothetical protein
MTVPPEKDIFRQTAWCAAILMTAAAVWLHFYFLFHAGGLWRDEVHVVNLAAGHSLSDLTKDSFPALMPLLLRGWSALGLGQGDLSLRLLGMLVGIGILAALWATAWTARRPPLLSLALVGLNSLVIFYGDSLRGYGLGSLFILLTMGAAWAFLKKPTWARAGILAATAILSVQALYQNAVLLAAVCFGAWVICWRQGNFRAAMKILLAGLAAAASLLPYWSNLATLPQTSTSLRMGFYPGIAFGNFDSIVAFPLTQYLYVWEFLALAVVGFGVTSLWRMASSKSTAPAGGASPDDLRLFAAATLLAALAGLIGFLWYAALPTQPWYFLPLVVLLAGCFDFGVPVMSPPRTFRAAAFGFIAATALIAVPFAQRDLDWHFTNVDRLARQLAAEAAPQDFIVVTPWFCGITFERYFKAPTPWQTLPPLADHSRHRYDLVQEQMKTPNALQPVYDGIAATLQSGHRVWVVGNMQIPEPGTPLPGDLPPPPLKHSGWSDLPYSGRWAAQAAGFLENHSLQFERVDHETNANVNYYESLQLFEASGWRNSAPETNKP